MGWTVTGSSAARAWHRLSCGTWEPGAPMLRERPKREVPVRVRVPMRSAGADRLVVVSKPGNVGGAKGPNRPASQLVKANRGAAGVDGETLSMFEKDLKGNLYKIWNRISSGSYFPPPVRLLETPKGNGKMRPLGIPTVVS
jgi:hypothetical protein